MCTATWDRRDGTLRLYFNRDERRTRAPGAPPEASTEDGVRVLAPRDGNAGGTWIAVSERGLALCLLNGYVEEASGFEPPAPPGGWVTRGRIVPSIAGSAAPLEAVRRLAARDLRHHRSFVLAAFHPDAPPWRCAWLDGVARIGPLDPDSMPLSSSSFRTEPVIARRRQRWREACAAPGPRHARHLTYHSSREDDGAFSVCMSRPDAQTVSFSWIEVSPDGACLHHRAAPPCHEDVAMTRHELARLRSSFSRATGHARAPEESPDRSSTIR